MQFGRSYENSIDNASVIITRSYQKAGIYILAGLLLLLTFVSPQRAGAAALPSGFSETVLASGLTSPTAMAFAPDGRLFVTQQGGSLRVIKNGTLLATPFVTVPTSATGERGLLGIAIDPNFPVNHYVYVYYTVTVAPIHNRVSRFTANGDVAMAGSEMILLELNDLSGATNHNGGAIHFGPDGKLYVAVGENANSANAQVITNRLGKILRVNSDGTLPGDNPSSFPGISGTTSGDNQAIWCVGLRNPYTFTFQPGTGRMFINDVGQSTWEEIDDGIAGSNYGWANCEGFCSPTNANYRDPLFIYGHGSPTTTNGCAITGGVFYNPVGGQFPTDYIGKYFYADYCSGFIRRFDPGTGTSQAFATGISAPLDLLVGGDGSLYYLANGIGSVMRVKYTQSSISGMATYSDSTLGAKNVTMTLTAPAFTTQTTIADVNGDYSFTDLPAGNNYTVTPSKTGDTSGITVSDAVKVGRFVSGLDIPTANQRLAADADGDGILTSYDATLIARFAGGDPNHGNVGTWVFSPSSRTYVSFAASQMNQNFSAILIGDVDSTWEPSRAAGGGDDDMIAAFLRSGQFGEPNMPTVQEDPAVTDSVAGFGPVAVSLPNTGGGVGSTITIPVTTGSLTGGAVGAYDLQINFDPAVIQPAVTSIRCCRHNKQRDNHHAKYKLRRPFDHFGIPGCEPCRIWNADQFKVHCCRLGGAD